MRITPLDVRKQEFRKAVRGFDSDEVNAFLATVADEYETVLRDNKELRERILELEDKVSEYRTMEKTLRDTLMTAERVMSESKNNAQREADLILKDAELRAQQVLDSFRSQAEELRREIIDLNKEKESYLARFRSLAEALIQFIDNHHSDFEGLDQRMMNLADTAAQTRIVRKPPDAAPHPPRSSAPEIPTPTPVSEYPPPRPEKTAQNWAPDYDEWRDYDPREPSNSGSRRFQDPTLAAASLVPAGLDDGPAPPAPAPRDIPQHDRQDEEPHRVSQDRPREMGDQSHRPATADSYAEPAAGDRRDEAVLDPSGAQSPENEAESQADAVVDLLAPMEGEISAAAKRQQSGKEALDPLKPREGAEEQEEKEPVRTWDMESFTRGLGDM